LTLQLARGQRLQNFKSREMSLDEVRLRQLEGLREMVRQAVGVLLASAASGARGAGQEPRSTEDGAARSPARPPRTREPRSREVGHGGGASAKGSEPLPPSSALALPKGCVSVSMGGEEFVVPVETLRGERHPDESVRSSLLAASVSWRQHGPVKIDRSPGAFPYVLKYLQDHKLFSFPESLGDFLKLESDVDFFGLRDLRSRLHVRLSTYLSCSNTAAGLWKWYERSHTVNQALSLGQDGTTLTIQAAGVYLVSVRDQQDRCDGPRTTELLTSKFDPAAACCFTADGPVSAGITRVLPLSRGDTISLCSEAPCPSYPYCALMAVRLDPAMAFGTWTGVAYDAAWRLNPTAGSLSPWVDIADPRIVTVHQAGRYVVSVCGNQDAPDSRAICVRVNDVPVARSRTNTGTKEVNSPSTAMLTQLLELADGDHLSVSSDAPRHNEGAELMMLSLPDGTSSASWEASSAEDLVPMWSTELMGHPDYLVVSGGRRVRFMKSGYHLVMLRTAHNGDRAELLQMRHNEDVVAACHVTTDGKNLNCSQLLEVIHAKAGDTVSAVCQSFICDEQLLSNLSVVFLRGD